MLVYASSATDQFDEGRIPDLLARSRENNGDRDVTGLLLYEDGTFLQILEGEADAVEELFEIIQNDPRHIECTVLLREPISERAFPDWSMGFRQQIPVPAEDTADVRSVLQERLTEARTSSRRVDLVLETIRSVVDAT